jgi:hypothetical protein
MSDLVEIFVTETAEEVTLNVTPNLIEVNVIKGVAPTNPITGTGTTNFLPKFTGLSTLGNSLIFDNGTNVGIGTTSPAYSLDVNGAVNVSVTNFIRYNGDTGLFGSATSITGGLNTQLGIRASSDILFATNGANERMRITSSGNVGIGTTSPQTLLSIQTSGDQNVLSPIITSQTSGVTYTGLYSIRDGAGDQRGLAFQVYTANVGLNERMRINSGGNVGIGTTAPTSRLHVTGLPEYATNTTAIAGGLTVGAFYHTAGVLKVVI